MKSIYLSAISLLIVPSIIIGSLYNSSISSNDCTQSGLVKEWHPLPNQSFGVATVIIPGQKHEGEIIESRQLFRAGQKVRVCINSTKDQSHSINNF